MAKPDIHPTWYPDAKVICNGEVVMTTGSTTPELHVDVWSGNHLGAKLGPIATWPDALSRERP